MKNFLWIISKDTRYFHDAINILDEQSDGLEIVGKAAGEDIAKVICKDVDVILVVGAKKFGMSKITQAARQLNLPEEKLLGDWIVCIPGFTLKKYRCLQRSRLSIFSMNCFGGAISHMLGLSFLSPFVNMFFEEQDYLRFLREPRSYIEEPIIFKGTAWEADLKFDYPIVTLGDVTIHMNHYKTFEAAVAKWNERKARINWYNLFVTAYTENEEFLEEFDALPYGRKVCFVPFKSDLDSAWYINPNTIPDLEFWDIVNHFGFGNPFYYDPFDMLLYSKKTPLIEM